MRKIFIFIFLSLIIGGCAAIDKTLSGANQMNCRPVVGDSFEKVQSCLGEPKELIRKEENTMGKFKTYLYVAREGDWKTGIKTTEFRIEFQDDKVIRIQDHTNSPSELLLPKK